MLWRVYSDGHEHTLAEEGHRLGAGEREIFDRCVSFLGSGLEYEWPEHNFIGIGGMGAVGRVLTLGLSTFVDRTLLRREQRRLIAMRVAGEDTSWPFYSREENELHRG